jgi:hypothetical protein
MRLTHMGLRLDESTRKPLATSAGLFVLGILTSTCSSKPTPPSSSTPELWGELTPVVSVKELMRDMIDPIADNVFDAVSIVGTEKGVVEKVPTTDADWEKIRVGGVSIAEGAYLLKVQRPFTPPGEDNSATGPDAAVLSAAQMRAKVEADPVMWNAKIEALRNVGLEVLDIVKRKDVNELWGASEDLDRACENCHLEYWYPGEKDLFKRLDRRLKEFTASQQNRDTTAKPAEAIKPQR